MNDLTDKILPTDQEIRAALEAHAIQVGVDQWVFRTHLSNFYTEAEALKLTRVNLMLGTTPNGSITASMLERVVDLIAALSGRVGDLELAAERDQETRMGDDL